MVMRTLACRLGSALLLGALLLTPSALARTKSALTVKSNAAVISVEIDAALRRHPGLADNCLAEARRWAEQMRSEADKEMKENPAEFSERKRWSLEREYMQRSVVGRYVSIVRSDFTYTGGAHPNTNIDTILWDRDSRKRISIRPFLAETVDNGPVLQALAKLVRIAVAREKIARGATIEGENGRKPASAEQVALEDQAIVDGVKPTLLGLGPVTLAPSTEPNKSSGFTFHFSPYAVGSYAEGSYTAFVPWTEIKPHLSPEGAAIFGGDRPDSDRKE